MFIENYKVFKLNVLLIYLYEEKYVNWKAMKAKTNKWKRVLNQPRLNSAIDFRLLAVLELTKVNEKQRLAEGGFEPA